MQGNPGTVSVWIRGNRDFIRELRIIALKDNTNLADLITDCLLSHYGDRLPESVKVFLAQRGSSHDQTE